MSPDQYLKNMLNNNKPNTSNNDSILNLIEDAARKCFGIYFLSAYFSGSTAKGTAIKGKSDCDIFVSISSSYEHSMATMYNDLFDHLAKQFHKPRKQNVSIGLTHNRADIDVVPGRRQYQWGDDHWLYTNKNNSHIQTNVKEHERIVKSSDRVDEIKILKIWRNQNSIDFPSIYLELLTIEALKGENKGDLANNVLHALKYIASNISTSKVVDPANTNNIISETLYKYEKELIAEKAANAAKATNWSYIVK